MSPKQLNEEKVLYAFHTAKGKGSMADEHWMHNKL